MEISSQRDFFCRDSYDDPNTVSNKLMLALRQLDFKSSFPSQKLKQAHGEAVCSVLEFLTDRALDAKGFKWGIPVYLDAGQVNWIHLSCQYTCSIRMFIVNVNLWPDFVEQIEQAEVDDEGLGDIEDDMNGGVEDDAFFEEVMQTEAGEVSLDSSAHNILQVRNAIHNVGFSEDLRF